MNTKRFMILLAVGLWWELALSQALDMDKELSEFSDKLVSQVKKSGVKKIAVLDFTDLKGDSTEFGRFFAEQLQVFLVERRDGFSIVDRANLKKIVQEHKLTVEGLVEAENAKKLGQFSGVDAIVLGNIATLEREFSVTAKVISTETAEIVGAAKTRIAKPTNSAVFMNSGKTSTPIDRPKVATDTQTIKGLRIHVESLSIGPNGNIAATLFFQNVGSNTIGCSLISSQGHNSTKIRDGASAEFESWEAVSGIAVSDSNRFALERLEPGAAVTVGVKYGRTGWDVLNNPIYEPRVPFRVQLEVLVATEVDGQLPGRDQARKDNFVISVPKASGRGPRPIRPRYHY